MDEVIFKVVCWLVLMPVAACLVGMSWVFLPFRGQLIRWGKIEQGTGDGE